MSRTENLLQAVLLSALLIASAPVHAVQVRLDASGFLLQTTIENVNLPYGFGSPAPLSFSVNFLYETDTSLATAVYDEDPNEVGYDFTGPPYFGSVTIGSSSYTYNDIWVGIANNLFVDGSEAYGLIPTGTFDGFAIGAHSPGAIYDSEDLLTTGIEFEFYLFADTSVFSDTDTIPTSPPAVAPSDTLFLFLDATEDVTNRFALGRVTSLTTTVVPVPAAVWLMLSGLIVIFGVNSKRTLT